MRFWTPSAKGPKANWWTLRTGKAANAWKYLSTRYFPPPWGLTGRHSSKTRPALWRVLLTPTDANMDELVLETNASPSIYIESIGGDLRLNGWDQNQVQAESDDEDSLNLNNEGGQIKIDA